MMKCNKCKRAVRNTMDAKFKHVLKYHGDILLIRAINAIFNPDSTFELGKVTGEFVKRHINHVKTAQVN